MEAFSGWSVFNEPIFFMGVILALIAGFFIGIFFQRKKNKIVSLVKEARFRAEQVNKLEKVNQDLEKAMRNLSAKEFELVNANRRLRELEIAKSKFISVSTHQLRTPLAGIKWTFNMLQTGQLGVISSEQKEFIDRGAESTQKMIKIVNDLLNINLTDGGQQEEYCFAPIDIVALLEDVISEFYSPAESKKINLSVQKPTSSLPSIKADRSKIKMALENLVDNAIKYTPRQGQVVVAISDKNINTANANIQISVKDSGIGIAEADKPKIFQKFFRSAQAVSVEPDGSGLGLHIVKDIVEGHHGTIWFESAPTVGTTFFLTLPLGQK